MPTYEDKNLLHAGAIQRDALDYQKVWDKWREEVLASLPPSPDFTFRKNMIDELPIFIRLRESTPELRGDHHCVGLTHKRHLLLFYHNKQTGLYISLIVANPLDLTDDTKVTNMLEKLAFKVMYYTVGPGAASSS